MISDSINQKIAEAMKARDEIRLSTLRMLSSALNYEKIAKQHNLSEEEEIVVVRREAKKRTDAIEALRQAQGKLTTSTAKNLIEKLAQEEKELTILKEYLPRQMTDKELEQLVDESISQLNAKSIQDIGRVIGDVMGKASGRAEGSKVAMKVKEELESGK